MDASLFLVGAVLSIVFYWIVQNVLCAKSESNGIPMPPGPWGLPIVGYLPFFGKRPDLTLMNLGKQYGSVYSMKMGIHYAVVLNDWKAYKAALVDQGHIFSARPNLEIFEEIGGKKGILFNDGQVWKDQRRFSISRLKDFGFGKQSLETVIDDEVRDLCDSFRHSKGNKVFVKDALFVPVLNVIWSMVAGKKFDHNDEGCIWFKDLVTRLIHLSGIQPLTFLPKIVTQLGIGKKERAERARIMLDLVKYMKIETDKHRETLQRDSPRDFMDAYLIELDDVKQSGNEKNSLFSEEQLHWIGTNFFIAGMETTTSTLTFAILLMMHHPHVQDKIHEEMDLLLGSSRAPKLVDRSLLPYTHAALLEIQRFSSIVPLSLLHRNTSSTTLLGYHIPKNSVIVPNLYAVDHDPNNWVEPDLFNPERFLNDKREIVKPDFFIPFSAGPRQCLGESVAKMELFLFFSNLMYNFRFENAGIEPLPSLEPVFGITTCPAPYYAIAKPRF